jgi:predicted component of type VI protein secretion system
MLAAHRPVRALAGTVLLVGAVACSSSSPEAEPRDGVLTQELTGNRAGDFDLDEAVVGAQQSLRVMVNEVFSRAAFTTSPQDTGGEPLLVVGQENDLEPGQVVQVVGTLRVFDYDDFAMRYALGGPDAYAGRDGDTVLEARLVDENLPLDDP